MNAMEYYLFKDGKVYLQCIFEDGDHHLQARKFLGRIQRMMRGSLWYMEDADGNLVQPL